MSSSSDALRDQYAGMAVAWIGLLTLGATLFAASQPLVFAGFWTVGSGLVVGGAGLYADARARHRAPTRMRGEVTG